MEDNIKNVPNVAPQETTKTPLDIEKEYKKQKIQGIIKNVFVAINSKTAEKKLSAVLRLCSIL